MKNLTKKRAEQAHKEIIAGEKNITKACGDNDISVFSYYSWLKLSKEEKKHTSTNKKGE